MDALEESDQIEQETRLSSPPSTVGEKVQDIEHRELFRRKLVKAKDMSEEKPRSTKRMLLEEERAKD